MTTEQEKENYILECLNSNSDEEILVGLVQIPFNTPDNIPADLLLKHIKNPNPAIKINVMQALGCYREKYHKAITDYIKENHLSFEELTMLQAALITEYSDYGFSYFYDMLYEGNQQKEIAMDMLTKYDELAVIPLLSKIDDASSEELDTIKKIYYRIGNAKVIRVVQGIPYYPIVEKMMKIFSEKEIREIYET